jgi:hypothetical protein
MGKDLKGNHFELVKNVDQNVEDCIVAGLAQAGRSLKFEKVASQGMLSVPMPASWR